MSSEEQDDIHDESVQESTAQAHAHARDRDCDESGVQWTRRSLIRSVGAAGAVGALGQTVDTAAATRSVSARNAASKLSQAWSTGLSGTVREYLIEGTRLFVATADGTVRTFDLTTGNEMNQVGFDAGIPPYGLATNGDRIAVPLETGRLKILDAESFTVERTLLYNGTFKGVAADGGILCLATGSGKEGIRLEDGSVLWRKNNGARSPVWITEEGFATSKGRKLVLFSETGEKQWQDWAGLKGPSGEWLSDSSFCSLRETNSKLILSKKKHRAYDKFTGDQLWKNTSGKDHRAAVDSDFVYHPGEGITAVDLESEKKHKKQWKTDVVNPNTKSLLRYEGSLVAFGKSKDGKSDIMIALDPSSRALHWEQEIDAPVGLVSTVGNAIFGVALDRNEFRAYTPGGNAVSIPDTATPKPNVGAQGGAGSGKLGGGGSPGGGGGDNPQTPTEGTPEPPDVTTDRASFNLSAQQTSVGVGETVDITFSAVNLALTDPMTINLVVKLPSGVEAPSVDGADEGSNQWKADEKVEKRGEINIGTSLRINEPGRHVVQGIATYYFGSDESDSLRATTSETITAGTSTQAGAAADDTATGTSAEDGPGFTIPVTIGSLGVASAVHKRFRDDKSEE